MKSQPSETSEADKEREILLKQFRAYLHLAITAKQTGQDKELEAMPGPQIQDYCRVLADLPDNRLASELAKPVCAILKQIDEAAMYFHRPLYHKQIEDPAKRAEHERILWQLDFALALILRQLPGLVRFRAKRTKCSDLICDATFHAIGNGAEAVQLVRRWQKEFPEDGHNEDGSVADGSFPDSFAWDVYQRVEALDKLADEFPDLVRTAARSMHAWPMLVHRHTNNEKRFKELAARLELGVYYPLDASEGARFRPNTPLVRYLDPLICQIHYVQRMTSYSTHETEENERESLRFWWRDVQGEQPSDEVVAALRAVPQLPPLTKATAVQWAEKAIVPVIMATDARDWKNCDEPALRRIATQRGVKSRATFKSRLLAAVTATLRRLARPA
jgi:hypothetical protein